MPCVVEIFTCGNSSRSTVAAVVAPHSSQLDDKNRRFDVKNSSTYNSQQLELLFEVFMTEWESFVRKIEAVSSEVSRSSSKTISRADGQFAHHHSKSISEQKLLMLKIL